ncbi:hypothetical protein C6500_00240 [Candidatus Poribacteria bacterium]|nr:MAG: hypothetical protein C6500_00240 [Candidatus Poribacteria bacterium]
MLTSTWSETVDPGKFATQEFITTDESRNRKITGAVWLPDEPRASNTVVAFGHGASGNRYQAPIPYIAHRLVKLGVLCVSMDGPVHGLRERNGGGRKALGPELKNADIVDQMNQDWAIAIELACSQFGYRDELFGYFGLSMGSIFGIPMLADRITKESPVTAATLGLLGTTGAASQFGNKLLTAAGKIDVPILFLMQLEDELFPRSGYLELFDSFDSSEKSLHANPGLHPEIPGIEVRHTVDFFHNQLQLSDR